MASTDDLSAEQIRLACRATRVCCLIGEDFSMEMGAPHFRDISRGIWSAEPRCINPFSNTQHEATVRRWFAWRLTLLNQGIAAPPYRTILWLQEHLHLTVATECVDQLVERHGVNDVIHLNGRINHRRCHTCDRTWGAENRGITDKCWACGGNVWPDVRMFGRNTHSAALAKWTQHLAEAGLLIRIATPQLSLPERCSYSIVDVTARGLSLNSAAKSTSITVGQLESWIEQQIERKAASNPWPAGLMRPSSAGGIHRSLLGLCRLVGLSPLKR